MDVLQQRAVLNVSQGLHVKPIRQRQLLQLGRDRLGAERLDVASHHQVHIVADAVGALGA